MMKCSLGSLGYIVYWEWRNVILIHSLRGELTPRMRWWMYRIINKYIFMYPFSHFASIFYIIPLLLNPNCRYSGLICFIYSILYYFVSFSCLPSPKVPLPYFLFMKNNCMYALDGHSGVERRTWSWAVRWRLMGATEFNL